MKKEYKLRRIFNEEGLSFNLLMYNFFESFLDNDIMSLDITLDL